MPGTSETSKARMCSNEGPSMPSINQNKWVFMWRDLVPTKCHAVLYQQIGAEHHTTVGMFSTAAENQPFTRDQGPTAKPNAENNFCKSFYAVASQWDWWRTPVKDVIKNHLHHVVPLRSCAWCVASGAKAVVHRWFSCFMILSGHNALIQICLHYVARLRSCASTIA